MAGCLRLADNVTQTIEGFDPTRYRVDAVTSPRPPKLDLPGRPLTM